MQFRGIADKISNFFKSESGLQLQKWAKRIVNTGVFIWLIHQLSNIGWIEVWQSFPVQPLFYILFLLLFLQLPLFEVLIYRLTWTFDALRSVPIFILKRVYNKDVLGYSGEVYFYVWAKDHLHIPRKEIFKTIKDNNIISSVASTLVSVGLLAVFIYADLINLEKWFNNQNKIYFVVGFAVLAVMVFLFIKFRHYVISMPLQIALQIFGIQTFRLLLGQFINLMLFYIVLPEVPIRIWFIYLAINIILSRIPFLPSKDFIFAGIGISIAGPLPVPQEAVAGIMIALGALNKITGFIAYGITKVFKPKDVVSNPTENAAVANEYSNTKEQVEADRE